MTDWLRRWPGWVPGNKPDAYLLRQVGIATMAQADRAIADLVEAGRARIEVYHGRIHVYLVDSEEAV